MTINRYSILLPFLSSLLLNGCAGNVAAVLPLGAALASCSARPNPARMVPNDLVVPPSGWTFRISDVRVMGPTTGSVPPPITAAAFKQALELSLRATGLLEPEKSRRDTDQTLTANIVAQTRSGTFKTTTLQLVVYYSVESPLAPDKGAWSDTITTVGNINDWKVDACRRLRMLQESLSRDNIRRFVDGLSARDRHR